MIPDMTQDVQGDARREPRTNMFVMATIYATTGSAPVKVRDMSAQGALIEGGVIPAPGTRIRLSRGSMSIAGEVVWRKEARAGLRFESGASVSDWLPRGRASSAQQRVDEIVQRSLNHEALSALYGSLEMPPRQVTALELTALRHAIESLGEELAEDPAVLARYAAKLQTLDLVAQVLKQVAAER